MLVASGVEERWRRGPAIDSGARDEARLRGISGDEKGLLGR